MEEAGERRPDPGEVTQLLQRMQGGDRESADRLLELVYGELRAIAGSLMKGQRESHTLQPTALVNEALARMLGGSGAPMESRSQFICVAAKAMRCVLVDHRRRKSSEKRGGGRPNVALDDVLAVYEDRSGDLLAVGDAIERLQAMDPQLAAVVDLRFFAGLTVEEVAGALGISKRSAERAWETARTWLSEALR